MLGIGEQRVSDQCYYTVIRIKSIGNRQQQFVPMSILFKRQVSIEAGSWNCSNCTFANSEHLSECEVCGQHHVVHKLERCPECHFENGIGQEKCEACHSWIREVKEKIEMIVCEGCSFPNHKDNQECLSCERRMNGKVGEELIVDQCPICMISLYKEAAEHIKACEESLLMIQNLRISEIQEMERPIEKQIQSVGDIKPIMPMKPSFGIKPIRPMKAVKPYFKPFTVPSKPPVIPVMTVCQICSAVYKLEEKSIHLSMCKYQKLDLSMIKKVAPTPFYLTPLQQQAVKYMHSVSKVKHDAARSQLLSKIKKIGFKQNDLDALEHYVQNYAPIIVHIHISKHMEFFVKDTHYRNQFETGKSSGTLSRDSRTQWENRMFSSKYAAAKDYQRVKYGTINFTNDPAGVNACKSYGSSYLLLKEDVRSRCTFTDMDSSNANSLIGTFKYGNHILQKLSDQELKAAINAAKANEVSSTVVTTYKEIQIHGPLQFARDVQRIYVNKLEFKTEKFRDLVEQFSTKFGVGYQLI